MLSRAIIVSLATGAIAANGITSNSSPHHVEIPDGPIPYRASDPAYNTSMKHFACGTSVQSASAHFIDTIDKLHKQQQDEAAAWSSASSANGAGNRAARARLARLARRASIQARQTIQVPLYIHVVTSEASAGTISSQMVQAQFNELNNAYNPNGVSFTLQGTTFTTNDDWAQGGTTELDTAMKTVLRKGSYNTLNLYFQTDLAGGILGQCTLPTTVTSSVTSYIGDGCNVAAGTMPGGPIYGYNEGKTAVHETGHWLGLLHTFENYSCTGSGDYIADTPIESQSTSGCPTNPWKNTCPRKNAATVDPIHNYMDYSIDSCYTRFTPDQKARMFSLWSQYRQGFGGGLLSSGSSLLSSLGGDLNVTDTNTTSPADSSGADSSDRKKGDTSGAGSDTGTGTGTGTAADTGSGTGGRKGKHGKHGKGGGKQRHKGKGKNGKGSSSDSGDAFNACEDNIFCEPLIW